MKRTIYLHGALKDYFPDPIQVRGESVAEAILGLSQFIKSDKPVPLQIEGIESDTQLFATGGPTELHLYPQTAGAGGRNGLGQVLLGVALIGLSFFVPQAGLLGIKQLSATAIFQTGAMMALGGILSFLQPTPEDDSEEASKYVGATVNSVKSGTPIPLIFGSRRHGGHYLSFDVDTKKNVVGDAQGGQEINAGDGLYMVYDETPLLDGIRPIRPVFSSPVASPTNVPIADWTP